MSLQKREANANASRRIREAENTEAKSLDLSQIYPPGRSARTEALDLLMAWNTGHQGGIASLYANDAAAGLTRLSTLVSMNRDAPREIEPLIGEAVDVIVHITRTPTGREVREILEVFGFDPVKQAYIYAK